MTKQSPTLALDLTGQTASLQQLAFDGHWHEMARASFDDIGLAEKMAFMRRVAVRLEGRRFYNTVWLPDTQIIERKLKLAADEPLARQAEARAALGTMTSTPAEDFLVELGETDSDGFTPTIAVRKTTLAEAHRFATSHGFRADSFSMNRATEGFDARIIFKAPTDPAATMRLAAKAAAIVLAIGVVLGGTYWADPFGLRDRSEMPEIAMVSEQVAPAGAETAPELAENNTSENEAPGVEIAEAAPVLLSDQAALNEAAPLAIANAEPPAAETRALEPLAAQSETVELPPVADVADAGSAEPPAIELAFDDSAEDSSASLAADLAAAIPPAPEAEAPLEPALETDVAESGAELAEEAVADDGTLNIAFAEAPAENAVADEVAAEISVARAASTSLLDDLAAATPLPEIAPTPEPAPEPEADEPAPAPEIADVSVQNAGYEVIAGLPSFTVLLRSGNTPPAPLEISNVENLVAASASTPAELPEAEATAPAPEIVEPTAEDIAVLAGPPAFVPLLRARAAPDADETIETVTTPLPADPAPEDTETATQTAEVDEASLATSEQLAALADAARLRPARRPADFAVAAVASDDIISGAAPRTARRALHRSADFSAQIAPLVTARASEEATSSSPALPPEPQTVALPTRASVARAATIENAINLREVALIGIYGTADSRRALVRLASGRYIRLTLGESFSGGWRIIAMDEGSIRVQKGSRTEILRISG